jgi:membrane associated rhomboid family serine protease
MEFQTAAEPFSRHLFRHYGPSVLILGTLMMNVAGLLLFSVWLPPLAHGRLPRLSRLQPVSVFLGLLMAIAFIARAPLPQYEQLIHQWGLTGGEQHWTRWITHAFVHADVAGLLLSLVLVWGCGSWLERRVGHLAVLAVFVAGLLAGAWLSQQTATPTGWPLIGGLGGAMALAAAAAVVATGRRDDGVALWVFTGFRSLWWSPPALLLLGLALFIEGLRAWLQQGALSHHAPWAFVGGLAAGLVLGVPQRLMAKAPAEDDADTNTAATRARSWRLAQAIGGVLLIVGGSLAIAGWGGSRSETNLLVHADRFEQAWNEGDAGELRNLMTSSTALRAVLLALRDDEAVDFSLTELGGRLRLLGLTRKATSKSSRTAVASLVYAIEPADGGEPVALLEAYCSRSLATTDDEDAVKPWRTGSLKVRDNLKLIGVLRTAW